MTSRRRMLTVRISDEARAAIESFCAEQGITVTAWIEAVGLRLEALQRTGGSDDLPLQVAAGDTVAVARRVDAERRARSPQR